MKRPASTNYHYRLVWSHAHAAWIPVVETAKGRSKNGRKLFVAALALSSTLAQAAPGGGQVVSGAGSIDQTGSTTTINQSSQNLSLNWNTFNVATGETVNFQQPNASAIAVNRIFDTNGSQILGQLNANGQVYLINPNGILFGAGAQVNVGGLVASTLDVRDADLNSNSRTFSGTGTGSVVNQGSITAAQGGSVALLGNTVSNQGVISAQLGTVALGAGSAATLTFNGDQLLQLQVDKSTLNNLTENKQLIQADGGQVFMTAGAKDSLLASVVNNTGTIEARSVQSKNGTIVLLGGMTAGTVNVGGTLDASAPNGGNGGSIETSAAHVKVADSARVTTLAANGNSGTWLIDPVDFTIAATGGDMTGAAVNTALTNGNFSIQSAAGASGTAGDINVNDAVSWSANTLTLNAYRDINVNSTMNATGTAGLVLQYGQGAVASGNTSYDYVYAPINMASTATFQTQQGSNGIFHTYTIINSVGAVNSTTTTDLQGMNGNLAGYYALGSNIASANTGADFAPIGSSSANPFTGGFDGLGHTIGSTQALTINSTGGKYLGLFGYVLGAKIQNVAVKVYIGGADATYVGGLVGINSGTIVNSSTSGSVYGRGYIGGLAGANYNGGPYGIQHSFSTANVSSYVSDTPTNSNTSYDMNFGGLTGYNSGTINQSYATGSLYIYANPVPVVNTITPLNTGGLVGYNHSGTITDSYSTGSVKGGGANIGGLIGLNDGNSISGVTNSYTTSQAYGDPGSSNIGGFIGKYLGGTITNGYWDKDVYNAAYPVPASSIGGGNPTTGITRLSSVQIKQQSNFASSWDFSNTWIMYSGHTAPLLRTFMTPLTITASNVSQTYNGSAYASGLSGATYSVSGADTSGRLFNLATPYANDVSAGSYTPDIWSNQQGYIITLSGGTLTIDPRVISLSGSRVYNGTSNVAASMFTLNNLAPGETLNLTGTGTIADKNVGNTKPVTRGSLNLENAAYPKVGYVGNYTLIGGTYTADITPKALTVSATGINKVYDGLLSATATLSDNRVAGDVLTLANTSATFANKNVANGKPVSVTGITVTGTDAGNYTFNSSASTTANITPKALTVSATGINKVYDGLLTDTVTLSDDRVAGDVLTLANTSATFANKNVANGKAVGVSGITVTGTDAGNYTFNTSASTTANITQKAVTLTAPSVSKTYGNGLTYTTTAGDLTTLATSLVGGDTVTSATIAYTDKNAGSGNKAVNLNAATISDGNGGNNYSVTLAGNATSTITPAVLTVKANNVSKTYDSLPYSGGNGVSYSGLVNGDLGTNVLTGTLMYGGNSQGATKAGSYSITPGGLSLLNSNYTLSYVNGSLTIQQISGNVSNTIALLESSFPKDKSSSKSSGMPTLESGLTNKNSMSIGYGNSVLQVINGGTKLPDGMGQNQQSNNEDFF